MVDKIASISEFSRMAHTRSCTEMLRRCCHLPASSPPSQALSCPEQIFQTFKNIASLVHLFNLLVLCKVLLAALEEALVTKSSSFLFHHVSFFFLRPAWRWQKSSFEGSFLIDFNRF